MTDTPTPLIPSAMDPELHRLTAGDRSSLLCLLAVSEWATPEGTAPFQEVATAYRMEYIASLAAEGRRAEAEMEAGRLSLDEVRRHLAQTVVPRLVAAGALREGERDAAGIPAALTLTEPLAGYHRETPAAFRDRVRQLAATPSAPPGRPAEAPMQIATTGGSVLQAAGLMKTYRERHVVNQVALDLRQGEIVGLLGPNGAGKTTTFYTIVGLIPPDAGTIRIDGEDVTEMPMFQRARRGIGYLSQEPSIFRKLTVEENILAILETLPISRAEQEARLEQLLDELSIKHLRASKAFALSGGERRRLEITRALVTNPKFMMLDEPFAGVDPIAVHDIQQIVASLKGRGIGVLISDHNVEQTLDIVDRAYIMFDGAVKVSGTVEELVFDDTVSQVYFGPTLTARLRERFRAEHPSPEPPAG
jgi:lipopolysaccharide export system ATP-binding protein